MLTSLCLICNFFLQLFLKPGLPLLQRFAQSEKKITKVPGMMVRSDIFTLWCKGRHQNEKKRFNSGIAQTGPEFLTP